MEVDTKPKQPSESRQSEELSSDSWRDDSNHINKSDENEFTQVPKRKSRQPRLFATYGPAYIRLFGKKSPASTSASPVTAPCPPRVAAPASPAIIQLVKETYYSTSWRTIGKSNFQDAPASHKIKAPKTVKSSQPSKAVNSKVPIATTIAIDEANVIVPPTPKKLQRPPLLFMHDKGRWSEF
ncbi:hypothetical protein EVAR_90995_1 [Eumeta japonica]|uniref:Uncharacterized protein n=1 Tax=Eumeta variegata TaxID=151549 RepID=A0A4C1Z0B6_EUMVA|nr:hypothetical protein EVAR_90995_1 [Eumeta japonica]